MSDAFTNFKGVTKSQNPAVNVPERVEIPIKVTQLPNQNKRGRIKLQGIRELREKRGISIPKA